MNNLSVDVKFTPRSNLEIYFDILSSLASKGNQNISYIMRKSNINSSVAKTHVGVLLTQNLLSKMEVESKVIYAITPKGMRALKILNKIKDFFQIGEKEISPSLF